VLGGKFAPGAANYCSNTFFTSPILPCSFPPAFSAVPRSCKSGLPVAVPAFSFTLPFASLKPPLILSFVLDFIKTKSRTINAEVVYDFDQRVPERTSKRAGLSVPAAMSPRRHVRRVRTWRRRHSPGSYGDCF